MELGVRSVAIGALSAGCSLTLPPEMEQVSHRSCPLPQTGWVLFMRWHDLLFLHWPVRPEVIRPLIPNILELDTFDGWCWIGVVPFRMSGVRPRYVPIPLAFPELNVRTYVRSSGRSGVWFFSLDADSWISVRAARWFGMPYYDAQITVGLEQDAIDYKCVRLQKKAVVAEFQASYRPTGAVYYSVPGTLDHWLTERYCLYAALEADEPVYGDIHHAPWPLQRAEVQLRVNTMTEPIGIHLPHTKPVSHFARYQEVVAWPIVSMKRSSA
jgi:uncharacterized protein